MKEEIKFTEEANEQEDESLEWMEDLKESDPETLKEQTYFTMINLNRKKVTKGEQAYYCYGQRSNMHLLSTYGFCLKDNLYDSFRVHFRLDVDKQHDEIIPEDLIPDQESLLEELEADDAG